MTNRSCASFIKQLAAMNPPADKHRDPEDEACPQCQHNPCDCPQIKPDRLVTDPKSYNFCPACGKKFLGWYTNGERSVRDASCQDCRIPFWWPGCGKSKESFDSPISKDVPTYNPRTGEHRIISIPTDRLAELREKYDHAYLEETLFADVKADINELLDEGNSLRLQKVDFQRRNRQLRNDLSGAREEIERQEIRIAAMAEESLETLRRENETDHKLLTRVRDLWRHPRDGGKQGELYVEILERLKR